MILDMEQKFSHGLFTLSGDHKIYFWKNGKQRMPQGGSAGGSAKDNGQERPFFFDEPGRIQGSRQLVEADGKTEQAALLKALRFKPVQLLLFKYGQQFVIRRKWSF